MLPALLLIGVPVMIVAGVWPAISHRRAGGTGLGTWFRTFLWQLLAGELVVLLVTTQFAAESAYVWAVALLMVYALPVVLFVSLVSSAMVVIGVKPEARTP
jgi:hypothetical protein